MNTLRDMSSRKYCSSGSVQEKALMSESVKSESMKVSRPAASKSAMHFTNRLSLPRLLHGDYATWLPPPSPASQMDAH